MERARFSWFQLKLWETVEVDAYVAIFQGIIETYIKQCYYW